MVELIIFGVFMCIAFFLGRFTMPSKKESIITIPKTNNKSKKKNEVEFVDDEATRIMLENIDNYNGSAVGQKDVPSEDEEW